MYNLNLDSYNLKDFNIRIDNSFFKNDRDTISGTLAKAEETTQIIPKSYELDNDNLIIYSYAIRVETADTIRDIGTFLEHHLNNSITDTIKANEDKFTLYKHTFKKGINKEYYWYSTENINDLKFSKTNVVTDNKDNRSLGKEITLIPDIKAKTLDMTISNLTVWNKIVFVASKTLDIPMECYEIASQNCYYSLEEIKDNYIKYFGENDYNNTVKILNTYKFQNDEYASFKNGKFYFFTGSLPANANYDEMGPKSYAVLVNKAITIDNKIEVYVYYTNIAYINNDNKTKIVLYADYDGNEIISESAYYTNDNINLESIADQEIKNNQDKLPIYKYVLLKENDNYYFDHIERVK